MSITSSEPGFRSHTAHSAACELTKPTPTSNEPRHRLHKLLDGDVMRRLIDLRLNAEFYGFSDLKPAAHHP